MSAPSEWVPLTTMAVVFATSLLGSLHCAGMCGPFVAVYSAGSALRVGRSSVSGRLEKWVPHAAYHFGRAFTYVGMGALGGAAGAAIDWAGTAAGVAHVAAVVCGVVVMAWGLSVLFPRLRISSPLDGLLQRKLIVLRTRPPVARASLLGVFTPLLPCGWLYSFVVAAAGTGHALSGGLVMAAFWAGTLPALLFAGAVFSRVGTALRAKLPVITGIALIVVGMTGVLSRGALWLPASPHDAPSGQAPCH